jgi:hypothetical protein
MCFLEEEGEKAKCNILIFQSEFPNSAIYRLIKKMVFMFYLPLKTNTVRVGRNRLPPDTCQLILAEDAVEKLAHFRILEVHILFSFLIVFLSNSNLRYSEIMPYVTRDAHSFPTTLNLLFVIIVPCDAIYFFRG